MQFHARFNRQGANCKYMIDWEKSVVPGYHSQRRFFRLRLDSAGPVTSSPAAAGTRAGLGYRAGAAKDCRACGTAVAVPGENQRVVLDRKGRIRDLRGAAGFEPAAGPRYGRWRERAGAESTEALGFARAPVPD